MPQNDHHVLRLREFIQSVVPIDLDFNLQTVDGEAFHASRLLGRPTILVLLRYLG